MVRTYENPPGRTPCCLDLKPPDTLKSHSLTVEDAV